MAEGFEIARGGKKRESPPTPLKLDGEFETKLIAMRLGPPPAGYGRWTLQLLADLLVALEMVESICPETVRKTLKKNFILSGWLITGSFPLRCTQNLLWSWKKSFRVRHTLQSKSAPGLYG